MRTCYKINHLFVLTTLITLLTACAKGLPQATSPLSIPSSSLISPVVTATLAPPVSPTFDPAIEYGLFQEQPAPIGAPVKAEDGLTITVLEVKRNSEEELVSVNPFNIFYPEQEAVLVRASVKLLQAPSEPFTLYAFDFDIMDESGTIYAYPLTVIVADELKAYLDQAVTLEGYLAFVLPRGHTRLVMRYSPKDRVRPISPRWFSLTP